MKTLLIFLVMLLISVVVFFTAGAVINASFNIAIWTEHSREIISAFWLFVVVVTGIILLIVRGGK